MLTTQSHSTRSRSVIDGGRGSSASLRSTIADAPSGPKRRTKGPRLMGGPQAFVEALFFCHILGRSFGKGQPGLPLCSLPCALLRMLPPGPSVAPPATRSTSNTPVTTSAEGATPLLELEPQNGARRRAALPRPSPLPPLLARPGPTAPSATAPSRPSMPFRRPHGWSGTRRRAKDRSCAQRSQESRWPCLGLGYPERLGDDMVVMLGINAS